MSQLDLAVGAGSTSRYVSFVETGRSRPGREVVLRLSTTLDLTLRESNTLLESAGLNPEYPEGTLNDHLLEPARQIVAKVLENHNPYPAWFVGAGLRFLDSNKAAEKIFPGLVELEPEQIVDVFCAPSSGQPEAQRQKNIRQMISALKQEMLHYPHPTLPALLDRVHSYATGMDTMPETHDAPFVFGSIPINGNIARTVSTVMRFDKATDVTVSEMRIELVFPADDESAHILREHFES